MIVSTDVGGEVILAAMPVLLVYEALSTVYVAL